MPKQLITPDLFMEDIFDRWPGTIKLFLDYRMACVGCSLSSFDTLGDALKVYKLPQDEVVQALNASVRGAIFPNGDVM
jgi:hybrid cluster-associated redox disulfide protein